MGLLITCCCFWFVLVNAVAVNTTALLLLLLVTLPLQPTVVLWGASDPWEPVGRAKKIFEGFVADFVELPGGYVWRWGAWGRWFVGKARCDSSNSMMALRVGPSKEQGWCSAPLMATAMSASACKRVACTS
jgi:hypothetical protein